MAYLGNTPTTQSFIAGTDTFSGTGSQTVYTLTRSVNSVNDILVVVNNVDQQPTAYSVSGTTLTFSAAPSSGTNNIYVRYLSTTLQSIAPSQGSVGTDQIQTNAITTDKIAAGAVVPADLSTGGPSWDASGNLGVNITSPLVDLHVYATNAGTPATSGTSTTGVTSRFQNLSVNLDFGTYLTGTCFVQPRLVGDNSSNFNLILNPNGGSVGINGALFSPVIGSAPLYGCRAWVNFNGTGTVAIRASFNVSSITDNGVGDYTINFTNALPDANYSIALSTLGVTTSNPLELSVVKGTLGTGASNKTSSAITIQTGTSGSVLNDAAEINASIFR